MTTPDIPADTIFALATAPGRAGVAVLRLSGPRSDAALTALTDKPLPPPREAALRNFIRPADKALLDKGLALRFPAPHSFTGEDVVELHLHGGRAIIEGVTAALAVMPGLRLAEPGEFTRRGFANGKFDLTEAEAVADLVHAETEAQLRQAQRQMAGELGRLYDSWRERLMRALAHIEAAIDFADEELPEDLVLTRMAGVAAIEKEIADHLADRRGERLRDGYHIAILGPPNAGKSSLLNWLARRDAAIVSSTAGTTRDIVEAQCDLGGYPVILADTAGLRETGDAIESEGVARALRRAEDADLKLILFDGASLPDFDANALALIDGRSLVAVNKADIVRRKAEEIGGHLPHYLSLHSGEGVKQLLEILTRRVAEELQAGAQPALTRPRHRAALTDCTAALARAREGHAMGRETALIAEDIRLAARALGRITGRVDVEDLLDVIFRDFCIGK